MLPVAEVKGAGAEEVAYTSFETSATGNWEVPSAARDTLVAATGKQSYDLVPGDPIVAELNADSDQQYIVSYWAMNGPLQVNADRRLIAPSTSGVTHSGWICYQHLIPAGTESVSLSAADAVNTIDELRLYPAGALMSTSTYEPLIGESSTASANNMLTHYKYDGLNRLTLVTDQDSAIVKQYLYNYGTANVTPAAAPQTLFYNSAQQQVFTKNSGLCADSSFADTATYRVAARKYLSAVSQAVADSLALAEITANGQAYADTYAYCLWYNHAAQARLFSTLCSAGLGTGGVYIYHVPAGRYKSHISQADADSLAQQDILTLGQQEANAQIPCSCDGEDRKLINGVCERGFRYNSSSTMQSDGTYKCMYYYMFSDGSITQLYSEISTSPCLLQ